MCDKARDIAIVLSNMMILIPSKFEKEHNYMLKLKNDLFNRAPELCNHYWTIIFNYVSRTFINNTDWEKKMSVIYNKGYTDYINKYKD